MIDIRKQWKIDFRSLRCSYGSAKDYMSMFYYSQAALDAIDNFQMDLKEISNKYHLTTFQLAKCIGGKE